MGQNATIHAKDTAVTDSLSRDTWQPVKSTSGAMHVIGAAGTALIGKVDHSTTGIGSGVTTVTTAGTDVVLAASTAAKWITVQAQTDNSGFIAVGASGVDATVATGTGVLLAASETLSMPIDNLADIYIDSTVSGEGVRYTYGT